MFLNYILGLLSVLLYLHGFFPIPPRPSQDLPPNNITSLQPKYKKAVLVIIDALRLDFVTYSKTPFLWSTHRNRGCFIQLKVETPTVTLPRIKAITTGNVPQFIDIIFNLASPTKVEDSFIHRAHYKGKKIVFYGDDIWTKLFPEHFLRSEGTSSFFVNDFTEVDNNVTRNVEIEKDKSDWDFMILHYLGLDHIGHVFGPKSHLILHKLKEMDSVIEKIYSKIDKDTFVIVTGDHGMRDSGGHGGSTFPETHVPFIVLGMNCKNDSFAQIDIAANLAILLGFDIPATSIGQLQKSLLFELDEFKYLEALKYNLKLLRTKLSECPQKFENANYFLDLFRLEKNAEFYKKAESLFLECSQEISRKLEKSSVRQNLGSLVVAALTAIFSLVQILKKLTFSSGTNLQQVIVLCFVILQFFNYVNFIIFAIIILAFCLQSIVGFDLKKTQMSLVTFTSILHPLTFFSSSYLEEEQEFWYFFTSTIIFLTMFENKIQTVKLFLLLASIRFIRTMNQVGDKWAALPDLQDWLIKTENYAGLQIIFISGLLLSLHYNMKNSKFNFCRILDALVVILIYIFRTFFNESAILGKTLWFLIFLRLILCFKNGVLPVWILVASLLLKPYNVIMIPLCLYCSEIFHCIFKEQKLILLHWWLGNLLFFAQGHDNSLASVDISSGYIGLTQYEPLFVIPQVLCHTYAFPILSHLLLFSKNNVNWKKSLAMFMMLRLYVVVIVFIVTFSQRHHLFVWSVFAPKMFVEASHFGFLFIEVCCYYLGTLIKKNC